MDPLAGNNTWRSSGAFSTPPLPPATVRLFRWLLLALFAPAGVLTGHCLTYAVAIPDPEARATMLMDTGHMWWGLAAPAAALLAVAGVLLLFVRRLHRQHPNGPAPRLVTPPLFAWLAPRLAGTQLAAFVGIEVVERLAVGQPLDGLIEHGILGHGIVAQALVSVVLTAGVWWIALTAQRLGGAITRPWVLPTRALRPPVDLPPFFPQQRPVSPVGARAPPLSA